MPLRPAPESENLQTRPKSLRAEHENLAATLQTLQGVEAEHNKAKGDVSQVRAENENLQKQLKSFQDEREGLNARLKTLESQVNAVPKITSARARACSGK